MGSPPPWHASQCRYSSLCHAATRHDVGELCGDSPDEPGGSDEARGALTSLGSFSGWGKRKVFRLHRQARIWHSWPIKNEWTSCWEGVPVKRPEPPSQPGHPDSLQTVEWRWRLLLRHTWEFLYGENISEWKGKSGLPGLYNTRGLMPLSGCDGADYMQLIQPHGRLSSVGQQWERNGWVTGMHSKCLAFPFFFFKVVLYWRLQEAIKM